MAEPTYPLRVVAITVLVMIIIAGVSAGLLYERNHPAPVPGPKVVALGDNVTVNYIGEFGSSAQLGRVFDTSILADARNNITYPKSLEYTFRSNLSEYTPLGVHVSPHTPSAGYKIGSTTFGGVVTGFWQGLLGLQGNRTHTIVIPPDLAYGPQNSSCEVSVPLVDHVPVVESLSTAAFASQYPNVTKAPGTEFTDPIYGWTDVVLSTNASSVGFENLPAVGFTASPSGWAVTVTNISAGEITVTNEIAPSQAGLLLGHSKSSVCSSKEFIVSAVDSPAGTFTENFNREVDGQTLIFVVTVVDIYP